MQAIAFHHQMIRAAALVTVLITAASSCGAPSGTRTTASPTRPSQTPTPSNTLFVMTTPAAAQNRYGIEIVGVEGVVVASTTAASPSYRRGPRPPVVSTTNDRAYFEDGDTAIRWLAPDGSTGDATTVPGGPMSPIGFAVSPDDTRIAVAALQYRLDQQTPAVQAMRPTFKPSGATRRRPRSSLQRQLPSGRLGGTRTHW